jgi:hypothetical protein
MEDSTDHLTGPVAVAPRPGIVTRRTLAVTTSKQRSLRRVIRRLTWVIDDTPVSNELI